MLRWLVWWFLVGTGDGFTRRWIVQPASSCRLGCVGRTCPGGSVVNQPSVTARLSDAGLDAHWVRVFHREIRDRYRGSTVMNVGDEVREEFTILSLFFNTSARIGGAARVAVLWSQFGEYFKDIKNKGAEDVPAVIIIYPADIVETWEHAVSLRPLSHHSNTQRRRVLE